MPHSKHGPWSNNPNAPKITYGLYFYEKTWLAGNLIASIFYGIVIVMFFKCMVALFNPDHRRGEPIKWRLVSYTLVMFSLVTIGTAMQLDVQSISYIDNRKFRDPEGVFLPGPLGYQWSIAPDAISIIQNIVFASNNWLADGLLLYRCYVVYSMRLWIIAFPCLIYLGSLAMGVIFIYQDADVTRSIWSAVPYFSISVSLNVLLTLMIVIRLIMQTRDTRNALGITGIGGLCKAIIMMLVESCALFAVSSLLVIGPLGAGNSTSNLFMAILGQTQVIASLLVIHRIASKSALTSNTIVSGRINSFKTRTRGELTGDSDALPGGNPMSTADEHGTRSDEFGIETVDIDLRQDGV